MTIVYNLFFKNSPGVETKCDVRQKDGAQCYGPLGGTVFLQLTDRAPERIEIHKNTTKILLWKKDKIVQNIKQDKYSFTSSDGTFSISNLIRSDTDNYTLMIGNSNGKTLQTLQLSIQGKQLFILQCLPCSRTTMWSNIIFVPPAPVSSPRLVSECLSQGEIEGGDSPQYRLWMDRHDRRQTPLSQIVWDRMSRDFWPAQSKTTSVILRFTRVYLPVVSESMRDNGQMMLEIMIMLNITYSSSVSLHTGLTALYLMSHDSTVGVWNLDFAEVMHGNLLI